MSAAPTPQARRSSYRMPRITWHRSYTAGLLVVALFLVYLSKSNGSFDSIQALGISNAALPLALVGVGETFVILTNGIDLSVGSIVTLANVTVAVLASHGQGTLGLVLAVAIGAGAGLANGLIVCYLRIAPLIATLATSSIFLGFALIILANPGGTVPTWLPDWTSGQRGEYPIAAIWLVLVMVVGWIILRRTAFGINLQALGGSESASRSAGIHVTRVRILAYVAAGVCSALAGIVLAGPHAVGRPDDRRRLPARRDRGRGDRRHEPLRWRRHDPGHGPRSHRAEPALGGAARQRHLDELPVHRHRRDRDRGAARALDAVEGGGARGQEIARADRRGRELTP